VRRIANLLLRNWPLRLGAILLATVLYSGLVLGQNVRTWAGEVPVDPIRPPIGATLLSDLDPVTLIRYRAPLDVGVLSPDSFRATVDLSRIDAVPGGQATTVPVTVIALDQRVQVVDYVPRELEVRLDPVEVRQMPVNVILGSVAEGLDIGPPQTEPSSVTVRGASSRVNSISGVVARLSIDASALNVDREIELVAVDGNGNQVSNVEIDPQRARVRIAVARQLATRTLPVVPQLTGTPAPGYRVTSINVEPLIVTVSGEEATVTRLETAPTQPLDIDGRTSDLEAMVGFDLPEGISVSGSDQVRILLTIAEERGSQTYNAGVALVGEVPELVYALGSTQVAITLGGTLTELVALDAASLVAAADVSGLDPGTHQVTLEVTPPGDLELLSTAPSEVLITISPSALPSLPPASAP